MTSLLYLLVTCQLTSVVIATNKTLYIGGLFDLGELESWKVIPAAQLAIDEINNNDYVTGYRLKLLINDTRGGQFSTASGVHSYLNDGPQKIMLLGPIDNALAKSIAAYAAGPKYRILQFSYGTDDLSLADNRNLYPYFFRTAISMASFDDLRVSFIQHYPHWKEVGIVHGDNSLDTQLSNQLKSRLEKKGIKVLAEVRLQENDPGRAIRTIEEKDIHIIFGIFTVDRAVRKLFCQAYRNGLYGPHYVWILQMAYNTGWWKPRAGEDIGGCHEIEMTCQVQNYFHVRPAYGFEQKTTPYSYSNKNTSKLTQDYYARVDTENSTANRSSNAWKVYDAVWSIAHVLKSSMSQLGKPLENVTYGDPIAASLFYNETVKLKFESPNMKYVSYFKNGDRKFDMNLEQLVIKDSNTNPSDVKAGSLDFLSGKFKEDTINWRAGTPYQKTTKTYITRYIHHALFGALIFLACVGLLYALICLIVVLVFRKQPIIWNSGPIINTIIILGCILNYITIILYAFDWTTSDRVTSLCRARAWTFAIGFTLSVGGLVAKLWIAYCVLSERFVRRWRNMLIWMLVIVFVLFILDVIIMGCWEGTDPLFARMVVYKKQELYKCFEPITQETFQAYFYTVEHCECNHPLLWLLIVLILKFLVVIFGVFLAWQTRKLYIKSLNDTQHCGFCLFVVFFFAIIGVLCALLTTKFPNLFFGLLGTIIFLCTTIILSLLFIHKLARVACKSRPGRVKTIKVGSTTDGYQTVDSDTESSCCSSSCFARCCSCCGCSAACCIACWSCFPCCNLFSCCKKCCCGSQVHPGKDDGKTEFYINGQSQDKEGQIAYLLRELHEREAELERLRPAPFASNWTQTYDDDFDDDDDYSGREDGDANSDNSTNEDGGGKRGKRRWKRHGVRIFHKGADYTHVRCKVDTGVHKGSPRSKRKQDEKYYLGVWQSKGGKPTDAEIAKLRAQLAEKDKEIDRLKKESGRKPSQPAKITIVNENGSNPDTTEKQCQTEVFPDYHQTNGTVVSSPSPSTKNSPSKKNSKLRKTSQNEPKDKIVIIKAPNDKEVKKEEEKPVQSSGEWLFGKPKEEKEKVEDDKKQTVVIVSSPEKQKNDKKKTNVIIIAPEEEKKKEKDKQKKKDEERKEDKKEDDSCNVIIVEQPKDEEENKKKKKDEEEKKKKEEEKKNKEEEKKKKEEEEKKKKEEEEKKKKEEEEKKKKEEEEKKKKEEEEKKKKEEEKKKREDEEKRKKEEEEKQKGERKQSRFGFFGKKDSKSPEQDKPTESPISEKSEQPAPHKDNLEKSVKPDSPETDKQNEQVKPDAPMKDKPEEKPVSPKPKQVTPEPEKNDPNQDEKQDEPAKSDSPIKEKPEEKPVSPKPKQVKPEPAKDDPKKDKKQDEQVKPDSPIKDKPEEKSISSKPKPDTPEPAKDDPKQDELPEDESPTRPPQNTPASIDQHPRDDDKKEEPTKDKPFSEDDRNNDDDDDEEEDDDDDDGDENDGDDEDGNNDDNDNGDDGDDNDDGDKNKPNKTKKKRKRIGGKLNWNAESKIDNSSGYKKRPTKKIKTFKSDYSHVRSKLYGGGDSSKNDKPDDNKDKEKRKPKRRVTRSRWNPNEKKTS